MINLRKRRAQLDRKHNYEKAFPDFMPLLLTPTGRLEGLWVMGNNYRTSGYYGAYPNGYLKRIMSMFPLDDNKKVMHLFSGSLEAGKYDRVDVNPDNGAEIICDAHELSQHVANSSYDLIFVDPPYSVEDAEHYGTAMVKRKIILEECRKVVKIGGWVIWLDQAFPMFSKKKWFWGLALGMIRSTNHRVRGVFGFERVS